LKTSFGKPFSIAGLGNFMAARIGESGLPDRCVTHGLRKAASRRLAEAGCSANEIASITGHKTLAEVERYTRAAEQSRLARSAINRLSTAVKLQPIPKPANPVGILRKNSNDFNADFDEWWARQRPYQEDF
jgi:hypothetical protein